MQIDDRDRATIHAALVLAIRTAETDLSAPATDDHAGRQRRQSAERLRVRFMDLLERLRK
jgi:hypothetical protein